MAREINTVAGRSRPYQLPLDGLLISGLFESCPVHHSFLRLTVCLALCRFAHCGDFCVESIPKFVSS